VIGLAGNASAPGRLAKYYFGKSLTPDKLILIDAASKSAYWATLAARVDPEPSVKSESQKMAELLFSAGPSLKSTVDTMLAAPSPPAF